MYAQRHDIRAIAVTRMGFCGATKEKKEGMQMHGIYRVEKRKKQAIKGIQIHHRREKNVSHSNPDIRWGDTKNNITLIDCPDFQQEIDKRIAGAGAKARKDSILMLDHFVGASPEFFSTLTHQKKLEFFQNALEQLQKRDGNVFFAEIHLDEATPHLHACSVPITADNRLSAKELIGGRKELSKRQDWAQETMFQQYGLERGSLSMDTARKHLKSAEYKLTKEKEQYDKVLTENSALKLKNTELQEIIRNQNARIRELEKAQELGSRKLETVKQDIRIAKQTEENIMSKMGELSELARARQELRRKSIQLQKRNNLIAKLRKKFPEVDKLLSQLERQAQAVEDELER